MENDPVKSIVDRIQERKEKQAKKSFLNEEQKKEYRIAINGLAKTKNGKYFLKSLLRYIDIFEVEGEKSLEPRDMFVDKGKRKYLEAIRPYLKSDIRKDIE